MMGTYKELDGDNLFYLGVELSRLDCDIYVVDDPDKINQQTGPICCLYHK